MKNIILLLFVGLFYFFGAATVQFNWFPYPQIVNLKNGKSLIEPSDYKSIKFNSKMVYGLPEFESENEFVRLPDRLNGITRTKVWNLSRHSSGGRIKFKTDSNSIYIKAIAKDPRQASHMTNIMKNGFDLYVNNEYFGSAFPDKGGNIQKEFKFDKLNQNNEITIHLPLYGAISIEDIKIKEKANYSLSNSFKNIKPIVYYGSSITQGGCASNPGLSYQAIISRNIDIDFINLGFSGNGLGDKEIASYISGIDASIIVLDYYANPSPKVFKDTLPDFVNIIRKNKPNIPIIVTSPFYSINLIESQNQKRNIAINFVNEKINNGDKNIHYFDGRESLSREQSIGLVDGRHPNSLGFWFIANGLEPKIKEVLKLK